MAVPVCMTENYNTLISQVQKFSITNLLLAANALNILFFHHPFISSGVILFPDENSDSYLLIWFLKMCYCAHI